MPKGHSVVFPGLRQNLKWLERKNSVLGWPQLFERRKLPVAGFVASSADKLFFGSGHIKF